MLTWDKEWIQEYESLWGIFEKFKFANQISGKEFFQFVTGNRKVNYTPKSALNKSIKNLMSITKDRLSTILKVDISEFEDRVEGLLNSPLSNLTIFNYNLCFCNKCISEGYHSIFHQYQFISNCPFHPEEALTDKCPNCNKNFRGYDLGCNEIGFSCENCKVNLVNNQDFNFAKNEWIQRKTIKDPFISSLINNIYPNHLNASYIFHTKHLNLAAINNTVYAALNKRFLAILSENKSLSVANVKKHLFSTAYKKREDPILKIGYVHRELYKDYKKIQMLEPKIIVQISQLKRSNDIDFFNKILDHELFNRSKAILKSVDRYIQRKLNRKINLKKEMENSSISNPYVEAYKNWKVSCYGIFQSQYKVYSHLGMDTPVFKFRYPFTFDQTQTYPLLLNSQIFDRIMEEFKNEDYSFSLVANVFCKLIFNFLFMTFQECLCDTLNQQSDNLPPFIQVIKRDGNIVHQVSFLNSFELFNIDLSLVGEPNIKWTTNFY